MTQAWPTASMRQRLLDLRQTADALRQLDSTADLVVEQSLARYLTVRSVGYVEAIRDDVADTYASVRAPIEIVRRVRYHLRTGLGVTPDQLTAFVKSFSPEWADELVEYLDEDNAELRRSLGAMVASRKKIAHGDGESVTTGRALAWATNAVEIGAWMLRRFDPN